METQVTQYSPREVDIPSLQLIEHFPHGFCPAPSGALKHQLHGISLTLDQSLRTFHPDGFDHVTTISEKTVHHFRFSRDSGGVWSSLP